MEITSELIKTIRNRVIQHSLAKYNKEPDKVSLTESGLIEVVFEYYNRGSYDSDSEYIDCEELKEDLDKLVQERLERERIQQEENEKRWKREVEERKIREKEERRRKYLEYKKEFENE